MSPKNKGKFGKSKVSTVSETDEFISGVDRIVQALKPHATKLAVLLGVVVVVVIGYTTWSWWQQRNLIHATELYSRAVTLNHVPVRAPEPTPAPDGGKAAAAGKDKKKGAKPVEAKPAEEPELDSRGIPTKFASAEQRASAVLAALEELEADYDSTPVAQHGRLLAAEALYQLGRYSEAADKFGKYADGGGPEDLVLSAREGLGYSLEAMAMAEKDAKARQAGLERTLKAFGEMQPQADGPRHDLALYHQARILAELGRKDQARKTLEQVLADHPGSNLKQDIEMRLPALRGAPAK